MNDYAIKQIVSTINSLIDEHGYFDLDCIPYKKEYDPISKTLILILPEGQFFFSADWEQTGGTGYSNPLWVSSGKTLTEEDVKEFTLEVLNKMVSDHVTYSANLKRSLMEAMAANALRKEQEPEPEIETWMIVYMLENEGVVSGEGTFEQVKKETKRNDIKFSIIWKKGDDSGIGRLYTELAVDEMINLFIKRRNRLASQIGDIYGLIDNTYYNDTNMFLSAIPEWRKLAEQVEGNSY